LIETGSWSVDGNTYTHRAVIEVLERSGATLTNYPVKLDIDTKWLVDSGYATTTGNEVRFTASDGSTLVKFLRETAFNIDWTIYFFKAPSLAGSTISSGNYTALSWTNFYIYFDASLGAVADGQDWTPGGMADFADHFTAASLSTDLWTGDLASGTLANSILTFVGAAGNKWLYSKAANGYQWGAGYRFRMRANIPTSYAGQGTFYRFQTDANNFIDLRSYNAGTDKFIVYNDGQSSASPDILIDQNTYHTYQVSRRSTAFVEASQDDVANGFNASGVDDIGTATLAFAASADTSPYNTIVMDWAWVGKCTASEDTEPLATPMTAQVIFPQHPFTVAVEPTVMYEASPQLLTGETNVWKAWFRESIGENATGQWQDHRVSYAESTNRKHWVYARGVIDNAEGTFTPSVVKISGTYYCYVHGGSWLLVDRWSSANGRTGWAKDQDNIFTDTGAIGNVYVWTEGTDWKAVVPGFTYSKIKTSVDGGATWNAGDDLTNNGVGFDWFTKIGTTYYLWGTKAADAIDYLPTWIEFGYGSSLLSIPDVGTSLIRVKTYEGVNTDTDGQLADCWLVEALGQVSIFYDSIDAQTPPTGDRSVIALATYAGTMNQFLELLPTITISAASSVTATTAILNGNITATGGEDPTVTVYWGFTDGGQTPGSWTNNSAPTSPGQPQGVAAFTKSLTSLTAGTLYYYSAKATNSAGTSWPAASGNFTTLIGFDALILAGD